MSQTTEKAIKYKTFIIALPLTNQTVFNYTICHIPKMVVHFGLVSPTTANCIDMAAPISPKAQCQELIK